MNIHFIVTRIYIESVSYIFLHWLNELHDYLVKTASSTKRRHVIRHIDCGSIVLNTEVVRSRFLHFQRGK